MDSFESVTEDKITKLHQMYEIICLVMLVDGIQTDVVIDISPCGTLETVQFALNNCKINLKEQLMEYFLMAIILTVALVKICKPCEDVSRDYYFLYGT